MPPSSRFRMNLTNGGSTTRVYNSSATINRGAYVGAGAGTGTGVAGLGMGLMISRVSSARPSCGACGK